MTKIKVRNNESFESALRRFTKMVHKSGILKEAKFKERYTKKSELKRQNEKEKVRKYSLRKSKKRK